MASLSGRTGYGVFWMILSSGGQTVFQFVLFIVLARQIGPEAFGLIGIAAVFIELSGIIGRAGLVEISIQRREFDQIDASTAFWSSIAFGGLLAILLFCGAGWLAELFSIPELETVVQILAPVSILYSAGAVYEAKIRREFGFKLLAFRNVGASISSGILALVMASNGFGVYSLVAQRIFYVCTLLLAMVYATKWRPSLTWNPKVGVDQIKHGSALVVSTVLGTGNQRIIDLIVGYVLGPTALGYLRIAWRALDLMMELSIRPVTMVTLTSLSHLQDDRKAFSAAYIKLVNVSAIFTYPLFLGAALIAPELIVSMFGEKWVPSIVPMQILTLTAIFMPPLYFKSNVLMALGAMRSVLAVNTCEFMVCCAVAFYAAQYGLEGAAIGDVLRYLVVAPIILLSVRMIAGISVWETIRAAASPLLAAGIMVAGLAALKPVLLTLSPIVLIPLLAIVGATIYVAALWFLERDQLIELIGSLAKPLGLGHRFKQKS